MYIHHVIHADRPTTTATHHRRHHQHHDHDRDYGRHHHHHHHHRQTAFKRTWIFVNFRSEKSSFALSFCQRLASKNPDFRTFPIRKIKFYIKFLPEIAPRAFQAPRDAPDLSPKICASPWEA